MIESGDDRECPDNPVTGKHMPAEGQCQLCLRPVDVPPPPKVIVIEVAPYETQEDQR